LAGKRLELSARLVRVSAPQRDIGQALLRIEIVRLQPREMLEDLHRVVESVAPGVCPAESAQGLGVLRLEPQAFAVIGDRRIEVTAPGAHAGAAEQRSRVAGIAFVSLTIKLFCARVLAMRLGALRV